MVRKCSMCSCGDQSSHAHGNIMQQHLLKPDLQLLSQVKDSPSELMTVAEASPWLVLTWPPLYQFVHLDPWPDWYTPHCRSEDLSVTFCSHLSFPLMADVFISPLKHSSDQSTVSELPLPPFNVNSSVSAVKNFFHGQRTLHLQYTAGLHLFSCSSAHSGVQPLKDSQHVKCSDHS